jgi:exopolysaccharide biosynthesis WecB/TagA/CpsF family protein
MSPSENAVVEASTSTERLPSSPPAAPSPPTHPISRQDLVSFVVDGIVSELAGPATIAPLTLVSEPPQDAKTNVAKVTPDFGRSETMVLVKPQQRSTFVSTVDAPVDSAVVSTPAATVDSTVDAAIDWPARKELLGVEVSITDYDQLCRLFITAARRGEPAIGTFLAVHGIVTANLDPGYRYRVNGFDVIGADGQPVRWGMNLVHKSGMKERVCGPTMMLRLCGCAADQGVGIYLYGSTPQTLQRLQQNLQNCFPTLRIVGTESPPFRPLTPAENQAACDRINASGAGIVFIGLGCPRQDMFAHLNRNRIKAVQLCVGAAFDFYAGNKKMAPEWMQKAGLEWTYRMIQEPRRLWKRYLVTNTLFIFLMARRLMVGR